MLRYFLPTAGRHNLHTPHPSRPAGRTKVLLVNVLNLRYHSGICNCVESQSCLLAASQHGTTFDTDPAVMRVTAHRKGWNDDECQDLGSGRSAGLGCSCGRTITAAAAGRGSDAGIDADRFEGRDHVGTSSVGDIGLFFVPTADTNGRNRWRGSAARTSRNGVQGQLNVADFTASFSYGLANRADVFVSWDAVQRVDRDISPLFDPTDSRGGGIDAAAPYARDTWSGNRRADIRIGGKVKVLDELSGAPVSIALRGVGRLPTGDAEDGGGVGAPRFGGEGIVSRWVSTRVVLTGSVGAEQRNNPDRPDRRSGSADDDLGHRRRLPSCRNHPAACRVVR